MTVRTYISTDPGAPVLDGQSGSLINVLDAILVNGYGSKSSLGWSKPFSGTNTAVYRAAAGNRLYLDVNDGLSLVNNDYHAAVRGYETMSAPGTGTGPFPTLAQATNYFWPKSNETAAATSVLWYAVGNDKLFYLWVRMRSINVEAPAGDYGSFVFFGEFNSYKAGDAYNTLILAHTARATDVTSISYGHHIQSGVTSATQGLYCARSYTQTGTSIGLNKHSDNAKMNITNGWVGTSGMPYPNETDGGLYMAPFWVGEPGTSTLRGEIPGMWAPCHLRPFASYDTFGGQANLAGKTFIALSCANSSTKGQIFFETSDTW